MNSLFLGKGRRMNRAEHLQWCKDRAVAYIERGDLNEAFASFNSDMSKHSETVGHVGLDLGKGLFFGGLLGTAEEMREWVLGFN